MRTRIGCNPARSGRPLSGIWTRPSWALLCRLAKARTEVEGVQAAQWGNAASFSSDGQSGKIWPFAAASTVDELGMGEQKYDGERAGDCKHRSVHNAIG